MKLLTLNNTEIDLAKGASIGLSLSSPFFSQQGGWTLPFTLPHTPVNDRLFGFLPTFSLQATTSLQVLIIVGIRQCIGTMRLLSASKDGFEVSVKVETGNYMLRFGSMTLADCLRSHRHYGYTPNIEFNISAGGTDDDVKDGRTVLMNEMLSAIRSANGRLSTADELVCLPVQTKQGRVLNDVKFTLSGTRADQITITESKFSASLQKGDEYGYGATVFLRLKPLIEYVFEAIGYTVEFDFGTTAFRSQAQSVYSYAAQEKEDAPTFNFIRREFENLIILNNNADTIMPGFIPYETLVPDMTVSLFLQTLFAEFGLAFFEKHEGAVVGRFIKTIWSEDAVDISSLSPEFSLTIRDKEAITLSHNSEMAEGWSDEKNMDSFFESNPLAPMLVAWARYDSQYYNTTTYNGQSASPRRIIGNSPLSGEIPDIYDYKQWGDSYDLTDWSKNIPDVPPTWKADTVYGTDPLRYVEWRKSGEYNQAYCQNLSAFDTLGNILTVQRLGTLSPLHADQFDRRLNPAIYGEYALSSALTDYCIPLRGLSNSDATEFQHPMPMLAGIRNMTCNVRTVIDGEEQTEEDAALPLMFAFAGNVNFVTLNSSRVPIQYASRAKTLSLLDVARSEWRDSKQFALIQNGYSAWRLSARWGVEYFHKEFDLALRDGLPEGTITFTMPVARLSELQFDRIYYAGHHRFMLKSIETTLSDQIYARVLCYVQMV